MQSKVGTVYHDLANAIVLQAVEDYRRALDGISYNYKPPEKIIEELEKFFHSEYYQILTTVDGDYLIDQLKKEHQEKERRKNENKTRTSNPKSHRNDIEDSIYLL